MLAGEDVRALGNQRRLFIKNIRDKMKMRYII